MIDVMAYKGGKAGAGVYQQIINQIPPHEVYIEPFLGGGAVMLHKLPAGSNIGIDSDVEVVAKWHAAALANSGDVSSRDPIVICGDAISYLRKLRCGPETFIYCDPPYLMDVRSSKQRIYRHEFASENQHRKLLQILKSLNCRVAISGYWSSLYAEMLATWRTISYHTVARSGRVVTEWLWMNYPEPAQLHDYRYLGQNFRERERIKRIKTRWVARLHRMEPLERYAILSSIAELGDTAVPSEKAI